MLAHLQTLKVSSFLLNRNHTRLTNVFNGQQKIW
ncbi:rCG41941, isoform CRA_b [Rattus norvegicus]|uniref:RCG41941, isoform CRA_b n=1 Tax=Rattus norvegicus TaxID=10116 RepID=A6JV46_RAT|nr:rCG41941, isoform CRA_b [Rattus norvegicus]